MENRQLAVSNNQVMPPQEALTAKKLTDYLNIAGVATKLSEKERMNFIEIAQAYCLNPFKREIYCVSYGYGDSKTTSIITGYEVYIKRAERTGKLDGWDLTIEGKMPDLKAIVTIYRNDWSRPFKHEVYFEEVVQRKKDGSINAMWSKMPKFMLRKVAIAQGFRLCFPDELGGMPYTADELPQEEKAQVVATVVAEPVEQPKELTDRDRAIIASAKTPAELGKHCRKFFNAFPTAKKELTDLYNKRLAELQKETKNKETTND